MSNDPNPTPNSGPASADLGAAIAGIKSLAGGGGGSEISDQKVREILGQLDDIRRSEIQGVLKSKGWYGSSKRGNGFGNSDLRAFKDLYQTAVAKSTDWQTLLGEVRKAPDLVMGSSSVNKVPSALDLKEILQQTALTVMGRKLDDKAVSNLVSSYQSASNGTASTTAPAADTFFKSRIEQKYGAESDATKYLSAISNVSKVLGSL